MTLIFCSLGGLMYYGVKKKFEMFYLFQLIQ